MPNYKLFYSPGACSMAVHIALLECGQSPELVNANLRAEQRNADFMKANPRGQVPVLVEDGQIIREGAAQMIYLLDTYKNPLLPQSGPQRAQALEWLCWANATLHPAYSKGFGAKRVSDDAAVQDAIMKSACASIQKLWDEADAHLAKNKYLAGDKPTMGDILMAVIANWSMPVTQGPNVKRVIREMIERPSYKKALAAEQVEYKAAA
ncbi:MAG: glutathione S-transferase family protein [Proteobacteria bacterium]|nr:glutathione S-transferase family protein [Pseudomonadota bacterium]